MDPDRQLIKKDFMHGVKVAKPAAVEIEILPIESVRGVIDAAKGQWRLIFLLLAATGIRAGKLRALMWRSVDPNACTIRITQSVKKDDSIGPPKTVNGVRTIPISTDRADLLRQHKAHVSNSGFVFLGNHGEPMTHEAL